MTPARHLEWRWLLMGPGLGFFCGFVTVTLLVGLPLMLLAPLAGLGVAPVTGALVGGPIGAGVGLVSGLPFVFLVGPHLSLRVAARRACALGATLPPLVLLACAWLPGPAWSDVPATPSYSWLGAFPYLTAAFLGGLTAEIAVKVDMPRTGVS